MKLTALLTALLAVCAALHAQTAPRASVAETGAEREPWFSVGMDVNTGFFYGTMSEFVYEGDKVLSRLDWQEGIVPYVNLTLEGSVKNFMFNFDFMTSVSARGGVVKDFDYMNPGGAQTHYSQHISSSEDHMEILPTIGYRFTLWNASLDLWGGFMYRTRKWSAIDGYTQYPEGTGPWPEWSESLPKRDMKGTIITYQEKIWLPLVALAVSYTFWDRLALYLQGTWYPYLEVNTTDTHILRDTQFLDTMKGGTGVFINTLLRYQPKYSDKMSFSLNIGWEGIYSAKGTIASGAVGYAEDATRSNQYYSKIESSNWWFSVGVTFYVEKLWQF